MKSKKLQLYIQIEQQINNTLMALSELRLIYYYNRIYRNQIDKNTIQLTWNNHESGKFNTNEYFLKLEQYKKILENGSYLCILKDGSIVRVSYTFENNKLIGHNLLWWPSPYEYQNVSLDDITPIQLINDFLADDCWKDNINMRSPVRIDYDPNENVISEIHPPVHLHTEHKDCRIKIQEPICFNRFIKYIFSNFYPNYQFYLDKRDNINFDVVCNSSYEYYNSTILL